jgi:type II secretory pathway component PulJ
MHSPRWRAHVRPSSLVSTEPAEAGFSLVEVLVGAILLAISLGMAGAMNGVATRGISNSTAVNDRNAAVDANIALIRSLVERYTWCSGAPALEASDVPTCLARNPSDESYYSPAVSPEDVLEAPQIGNNSRALFEAACQNGTLTTDLINQINSLPLPQPDGTTRNVSAINVNNIPTHRIQILFESPSTDKNSVVRSLVITPPVAAFCS